MRILCYKCGEWMVAEKWVTVRPVGYMFGFHGDILKCPRCGNRIIVTANVEDTTLKHAEIVYLKDDDEKLGSTKQYVVHMTYKVTVEADNEEEAIELASEELIEELGFAEPYEFMEVYTHVREVGEGDDHGNRTKVQRIL